LGLPQPNTLNQQCTKHGAASAEVRAVPLPIHLFREAKVKRPTKREMLSDLANSLDNPLARELVEKYGERFNISDVEKLLLAKIRKEISDEAQDNQDQGLSGL
jgi:hypothetical protein